MIDIALPGITNCKCLVKSVCLVPLCVGLARSLVGPNYSRQCVASVFLPCSCLSISMLTQAFAAVSISEVLGM